MSLRKRKPTPAAGGSGSSKKKSLSDTISDLLLPRPLLDPEIDADDETRAREHAYDAGDDDDQLGEIDARFSDIRKKNVKLLQDVDRKYSGKIASRKDFEEEAAEESEDDAEKDEDSSDEGEQAYEDSSDDELVGKSRAIAEDTDSEDYSEKDEDEEDDDDEDEAGVSDDQADDADSDVNDDDDDDDDDDDSDASDFADNDDIDLAPKSTKSAAAADDADDATVHVKPMNASVELQKGHSVQNQLHIWEKLLEMRIHSQKILIHANSLPSHEKLAVMADQSPALLAAADTVSGSVSHMLDKLTELQQLLVGQFPESKELNVRKRKHTAVDDATDDDESQDQHSRRLRRHGGHLTDSFAAYKDYRNAVLLKWYDRTKVLTPGSKEGRHAAQHNILQNIDGALATRGDLVRKSQLHKGGYKIIGRPEPVENDPAQPDYEQTLAEANAAKLAAEEAAHCAEIYDDSDFYHTQLRELIECKAAAASTPDEMNRQFAELQKLRKKMKKVVDTRATKGRKIRYVVHNKMVNFMARHDATEWTEEGKTELYSSLFGARL